MSCTFLYVCRVYYCVSLVHLLKPLLIAWLPQAFLTIWSCPQYHVVFFFFLYDCLFLLCDVGIKFEVFLIFDLFVFCLFLFLFFYFLFISFFYFCFCFALFLICLFVCIFAVWNIQNEKCMFMMTCFNPTLLLCFSTWYL